MDVAGGPVPENGGSVCFLERAGGCRARFFSCPHGAWRDVVLTAAAQPGGRVAGRRNGGGARKMGQTLIGHAPGAVGGAGDDRLAGLAGGGEVPGRNLRP